MLTISVKNFGPIAEGSVDLKPLTIFVGPSNTGKSYMATAVYAVTMAATPYIQVMRGEVLDRQNPSKSSGSLRIMEPLWEWADSLLQSDWTISDLSVASLPESARLWLENLFSQQLSSLSRDVGDQLRQLHGDAPAFVRQGSQIDDFDLVVCRDEPKLNLRAELLDTSQRLPEFEISQISVPRSAFEVVPRFVGFDHAEYLGFRIAINLTDVINRRVFSEFPYRNYYLPAARSGIVHGHKVLAATLARQSRRIGLDPMSIPSLPGTATEFLGNLLELDKHKPQRPQINRQFAEAIDFIEDKVLGGKIDLDESRGLPVTEIVYMPNGNNAVGREYTLEHTSSMVSELAPLILFLKYLVRPGDLLILEEPESHLHPAAQLQMARGIARLVNAGVQVLITTHSNDFVGQINNLISMSNVSEETSKSLGLEQEECLQPDQVNAYGFRIDPDLGGAVTYPLPVGSDVGIEDEEFLPVIELLYEQAITLQRNRIT